MPSTDRRVARVPVRGGQAPETVIQLQAASRASSATSEPFARRGGAGAGSSASGQRWLMIKQGVGSVYFYPCCGPS